MKRIALGTWQSRLESVENVLSKTCYAGLLEPDHEGGPGINLYIKESELKAADDFLSRTFADIETTLSRVPRAAREKGLEYLENKTQYMLSRIQLERLPGELRDIVEGSLHLCKTVNQKP